MAVRFIFGAAGSGKTHAILQAVRRQLQRSPSVGPPLILLVPEQAGLQTERALLDPADLPGAHRCQVLGFTRLASLVQHRAATGDGQQALSAAGRVFVIRHLIARQPERFRVFRLAARQPGMLERLATHVAGLAAAGVDPDDFDAHWAGASDAVADLLELHRQFRRAIPPDRRDASANLRAVCQAIRDGFFPRETIGWIDGFAHLSGQELAVVIELARSIQQLSISLLVDPDSPALEGSQPVEPFDLFAPTLRTYHLLSRALTQAGVPIAEPMKLRPATPPRFASSPALARLQHDAFQLAPKTEPAPGKPPASAAVRCVQAPDRRGEVQAAVAEIQRLVQHADRPMRYRDMAIIVRDLEPYHDLLAASLTAHGIPHFIDRRTRANHHPLLAFVRGVLAVLSERFSPSAVVGLIKTGLSGVPAEIAEAFENYVMAFGLAGPQWFLERTWDMRRATDSGRRLYPDPAELCRLEAARSSLAEMLRPWHDLAQQSEMPTAGQWTAGLFDRLQAFRVVDRLAEWTERDEQAGRHTQAALHRQLWEQLIDRLEEMSAVLAAEPLSVREFADLLEVALASLEVAVAPPCIDRVLVGEIARSRHPDLRAVLLLGMTADAFPARPEPDAALTDEDLQYLMQRGVDLGQPSTQRVLDERLLAYIAFTRAGDRLYLSWPARDERGQPLRPSPYLAAVRAAVPDMRDETWPTDFDLAERITGTRKLVEHLTESLDSPDAASAALRTWLGRQPDLQAALDSIIAGREAALPVSANPELVGRLWPAPLEASVSRLECFAQCPFKHLARFGLGLQPRLQAGLQPMDRGTLYHQILAKLTSRVAAAGGRLDQIDEAELADWVADAVQQQLTELRAAPHLAEPRSQYLLQRCQQDVQAVVMACRAMAARGRFRILAAEQSFGAGGKDAWPLWTLDDAETGLCLRVRGRIDRLDVADEPRPRAVVIDYKTHRGRQQGLPFGELLAGCELQLPAYLSAACAHLGVEPGGAFYLPLIPRYEPQRSAETEPGQTTPYLLRGIYAESAAAVLDSQMQPGESSGVIKAAVGRNRQFDRRRSPDAVGDEQLKRVLDYVGEMLLRLTGQMLAGRIEPLPVERAGRLTCEYCDFAAVCRFDPRRHPTRAIERIRPAEAIERISIERQDHEVDG